MSYMDVITTCDTLFQRVNMSHWIFIWRKERKINIINTGNTIVVVENIESATHFACSVEETYLILLYRNYGAFALEFLVNLEEMFSCYI